jgi:phosphoesterase RecJ-like protein
VTGLVVGPPGASSPPAGPATPSAEEWAAAVAALRDLPEAARVLLICHVNPDGDALGSMLGFALGLRRLGLGRVQATFPGSPELPEPFHGMPGLDLLVPAESAWTEPDVVVCFDAASRIRLGGLADRLDRTRMTLVLDHHASNTRFGDIHLVDADAAATAVVVEGLLTRLGVPLDAGTAECLYIALVTDTGSFRFGMTTPAVHEMAARLISAGLRPAEISRRLFDTRPFGAVRLHGEVLGRTRLDPAAAHGHGLVWTYATQADLARYGQRPHVLEPLIDAVRCTAEADVGCLLKQTAEGEWAVSLRSKGAVDVSQVAVALGGGGHRLAAGFTGHGSAEQVVEVIRAQLPGAVIRPGKGIAGAEDQG